MTPQNNIPPDMDALLAWLKEQALEAHNKRWKDKCKDCEYNFACVVDGGDKLQVCGKTGERHAFNRVIAKIENSRVNQKPNVPVEQ